MSERDQVVMMSRIRREERWIRRNLERTFLVAKTAVLWDDGSDDSTPDEALLALTREVQHVRQEVMTWGWRAYGTGPEGERDLYFINSPFARADVRPIERVSEIRDKNALWSFVKSNIVFQHVLCLDGDEMLSRDAVRRFPEAISYLETDTDVLTMPFIYLWDSEGQQRVDGIYGDAPDGIKTLRFPRLFTIKRMSELDIFNMRFAWHGQQGGFHCGSIPQENFRRSDGTGFHGGTFTGDVVHFGYIDNPLRQKKFAFYNEIDPGNEGEGCYKHIIGEPDIHAPGPVQLEPYVDAGVLPHEVEPAGTPA